MPEVYTPQTRWRYLHCTPCLKAKMNQNFIVRLHELSDGTQIEVLCGNHGTRKTVLRAFVETAHVQHVSEADIDMELT